jgi:hypothetical protein
MTWHVLRLWTDEPPDVEGICKYTAQPTMGGPTAWRLGKALTIPHCKNLMCYKTFHKPWTWTDSLERCKQQK